MVKLSIVACQRCNNRVPEGKVLCGTCQDKADHEQRCNELSDRLFAHHTEDQITALREAVLFLLEREKNRVP